MLLFMYNKCCREKWSACLRILNKPPAMYAVRSENDRSFLHPSRYFDEHIMPKSTRNGSADNADGTAPPQGRRHPQPLHRPQRPEDSPPSKRVTKGRVSKGRGGFSRFVSIGGARNLQGQSTTARRSEVGSSDGVVTRCTDLKLTLKQRLDK